MEDSNQQTLNQVDSSGQEIQTFTQHSRKKFYQSKLIIGIIVLAIISISSSAYFLISPSQKKVSINRQLSNINEIKEAPTITPSDKSAIESSQKTATASSKKTDDPTATWSAYTNSRYGYSIKYPKGWTVKNMGQLEPKVIDYVVFDASSTSANTVTISYSTRTYEEAKAIGAQNSESIKVDSIKGVKKEEKDSNNNVTLHIILPVSGNTLIIYAKDAYKEIFNQMLNTLKFLN